VTGYRAEEIMGHTPRMLASGRHDAQFYKKIWTSLKETGHWQGEIWDRRRQGKFIRNGCGSPWCMTPRITQQLHCRIFGYQRTQGS